ncbi:MAG: hypothetical protein H6540_09530 [Bacteroidales bacterium]|nr:hypothetical protein [Bacteroidales bacterium]
MKPSVFGDATLGLSPLFLGNTINGNQPGGSLNMQFYLAKWISLDADLAFSKNYFHMGPGTIALPIWLLVRSSWRSDGEVELSRESFQNAAFLGAITLLSLEHLSIHIPVQNRSDFSPYVSLLRYRSNKLNSDGYILGRTEQQFCLAAGASLDNYFGRFILSPFFEYNRGYTDGIGEYIFGVRCSYGFTFSGR